jgi:hypothetical protein
VDGVGSCNLAGDIIILDHKVSQGFRIFDLKGFRIFWVLIHKVFVSLGSVRFSYLLGSHPKGFRIFEC